MKRLVLLSAGIVAFALQSAHAQILETTFDDWTNWNSTGSGLTFQGTNTFDYDGVTVDGINNPSLAGDAGTGGALEVSPIVPCNWGLAGPAFGLAGVTTAALQAMDGPGAGGSTVVAQSGTLLVDYTMPDHSGGGTYFNFGIFFQDNAQWGGWSAAQNIDLGPVTTPSGTEEMYEAVIPYSLSATTNLTYTQIGFWIFTDYQGSNPWYVDNISVVPIFTPPPPAPRVSLFTTTNDFAEFTAGGGDLILATNDWDFDMNITNGLGDTSAPGAIGNAGSLLIDWSSLETGYGSVASGPDEETNAVFMEAIDPGCNTGTEASVAAYGNLYMDYSMPDNSGGGNYFQLGIGLGYNADGYYQNFFPSSTKDLGIQDNSGYEVYEATIPYTITPGYYYGFNPWIAVNSNYQPTNGFHVDNITVSSAQAPIFTSVTLTGTSLVLQGTNGLSGYQYTLLSTTNLTSKWTVAAAGNTFYGTTFTNTVTVSPSSLPTFYRIQTVAP